MDNNLIKSALYYAHPQSGASVDMAHGIIVGIVTTLVAQGMAFDKAIKVVYEFLPQPWRLECMPPAWSIGVQS